MIIFSLHNCSLEISRWLIIAALHFLPKTNHESRHSLSGIDVINFLLTRGVLIFILRTNLLQFYCGIIKSCSYQIALRLWRRSEKQIHAFVYNLMDWQLNNSELLLRKHFLAPRLGPRANARVVQHRKFIAASRYEFAMKCFSIAPLIDWNVSRELKFMVIADLDTNGNFSSAPRPHFCKKNASESSNKVETEQVCVQGQASA